MGVCLHRALALAVLPSARTDARVTCAAPPTESAAQAKALGRMVTDLGVRGAEAAITLPPNRYTMLQIERPDVDDDELGEAARWRVASMLDYPVEEAKLQVFDMPQPSERQRQPMLNVVATPMRAVRELADITRKAGLRPRKVTIAELAVRDLVAENAEDSVPTMSVFLADRLGLIQATHKGRIFLTRRLDYGLTSVKPVDTLSTGIHNTLPLELRRTIDYFDSHYSAGSIRRLLAGPAENAFVEFMRQAGDVIGVDVTPLSLGVDMESDSSKPPGYGMPEAYLALGGALSLERASEDSKVAV